HLGQFAVAEQVDAAVAGVADQGVALPEQDDHHGGTHALAGAAALAPLVDLAVRLLEGGVHLALEQLRRDADQLAALGLGQERRQDAADRVDDHAARLVAGVVAAHAVGDGQERDLVHAVERGPDDVLRQVTVLVALADAAGGGGAAYIQARPGGREARRARTRDRHRSEVVHRQDAGGQAAAVGLGGVVGGRSRGRHGGR